MPRFAGATIKVENVDRIVCHRSFKGNEEYLIKWGGQQAPNCWPYSWHPIYELAGADGLNGSSNNSCLKFVQIYLNSLRKRKRTTPSNEESLKRKNSEPHSYRLSPFERTEIENGASSRASSLFSTHSEESNSSTDVSHETTYNCKLEVEGPYIVAKASIVHPIDTSDFPTTAMLDRARLSSMTIAETKIRAEFIRDLQHIRGAKPIKLVNTHDTTSPPLSFHFVDEYVYGKGVYPPDPDALIGCKNCRPDMGGHCGCEYTKVCECLEYAEVAHAKLTEEEELQWQVADRNGESTLGLPKRFPYSKGTGYLVQSYINSGFPIYECNEKCACGPICKSRVVQKGRHVGLEIFKTRDRGWGLRSTEHLRYGEFIDTYRGEVITDEEATKREDDGDKDKESYLFSLDKHHKDAAYVVDGQYFGGPSRFINHSCDPNCAIYAVSYDKNNTFIYDLAFFAVREIPPGQELTFDYCAGTSPDEFSSSQQEIEVEDDSIPCRCKSANCRKWLWK
ncbi:SET domain-containing protein [Tothia fuscella]|uniref:SET domain-containing protein n=1 Tax=Tothia fuscella TaxID=1048955 RepID=A0A9P4TZN3_9PEZI|nr:SET domain-containing protein [Tothia fuscella]